MRFFIAIGLLASQLFIGSSTHAHETPASTKPFLRSAKRVRGDYKRIKKVPRTPIDYGQRLSEHKGIFKGIDTSDGKWRSALQDGSFPFAIPLGNDIRLEGSVLFRRGVGPLPTVRKLTQMEIVRGNQRKKLLKEEDLGVFIDSTTGFFYKNDDIAPNASEQGYARLTGSNVGGTRFDQIRWHGPISRYALFAYFHEQGHARDWKKLDQPGKNQLRAIYNKVAESKVLSGTEKQLLIGFERSAWAHALKDVRGLRKQKMGPLQNAPVADLMDVVHGSLRYYYEYAGGEAQ